MKIKDIRMFIYEVYTDQIFQMIDIDEFVKKEIEQKGIIVIDEIDKLVKSSHETASTKASDEGVQYDLLPLLDGTSVAIGQKQSVDTRNILFVGAGAFEKVKPTDLIIEMQGRMPISAKMESLTKDDFVAILSQTECNLLDQAIALLKIERVNLLFTDDCIEEMAQVAVELNEEDNIGARRLRTVLDAVLEDIHFEAPDFEVKDALIEIGKEYVREKTVNLYQNRDFRQYTM